MASVQLKKNTFLVVATVRRFLKVDTDSLMLSRGFVDLAYQEGDHHECQTEPGSGVHSQRYPS